MRRFTFTVATAATILIAAAAHASFISYTAILRGPSESPPNASPGTGSAAVDVDTVVHTMHVHIDFSGLLGTTTASHIHAATASPLTGNAGVATTTPTFAGFPIGVTAGTYDNTLDMTLSSSYNPAYITANGGTTASAEAALFASLAADKAYLNIHTSAFSGGEIRGFLIPVPEPSTLALLAISALGLLGCAWHRRGR
jgi:hypothetical protein